MSKLSDRNRALSTNPGDLAGLLTDVSLLQTVTGNTTFCTDCAQLKKFLGIAVVEVTSRRSVFRQKSLICALGSTLSAP